MKNHLLAICLAFAVAVPAFAKDERSKPEGRGMRLAGILVTSIGGGVGAAVYVIGAIMGTCVGSKAGSETKKECEKNASDTQVSGAVLLGVSAAIGVPLIVVGQNTYKEWLRDHPEPGSEPPPKSAIQSELPHRVAYELPVFRVLL